MLNRRTQELLERITGNPAIGKGKKLVIGDGAPHLEADTIAFIKSATATLSSELVKSHLGGRRLATIQKRAAMTPITADEMQGAAPTVAPASSPRTTPGLSDPDLKVLEQQVTDEQLTPAKATVRFAETYDVINRNMGRRMSATE
jgi:hypothetical protein